MFSGPWNLPARRIAGESSILGGQLRAADFKINTSQELHSRPFAETRQLPFVMRYF